MHELTVAQEIMQIVRDQQGKGGFEKVEIIRLKAGCFSCIDEHALKFAFRVVSEGTSAESAQIELKIEPFAVKCQACGRLESSNNIPTVCAVCRSEEIKIEGDSTFEITALEVQWGQ